MKNLTCYKSAIASLILATYNLCGVASNQPTKSNHSPELHKKFSGFYFNMGCGIFSGNYSIERHPFKDMNLGYAGVEGNIGGVNLIFPTKAGFDLIKGFDNVAIGLHIDGTYDIKEMKHAQIKVVQPLGTISRQKDTMLIKTRRRVSGNTWLQFGPCIDKVWIHGNLGGNISTYQNEIIISGGDGEAKPLAGFLKAKKEVSNIKKWALVPGVIIGGGLSCAPNRRMNVFMNINYVWGMKSHTLLVKYDNDDAIKTAVQGNEGHIAGQKFTKYRGVEYSFGVKIKL